MATGKVEVKGLAQLSQNLKKLKLDTRFKICDSASRAGANVIKRQAIKNAPMSDKPHQLGVRKSEIAQPGNLKKNIITLRVKQNEITSEHEVRVRQGTAKAGKDAFYWLFLEFGTVKMQARPFMRPAFAQTRQAAADKTKDALAKGIDKATKKLTVR